MLERRWGDLKLIPRFRSYRHVSEPQFGLGLIPRDRSFALDFLQGLPSGLEVSTALNNLQERQILNRDDRSDSLVVLMDEVSSPLPWRFTMPAKSFRASLEVTLIIAIAPAVAYKILRHSYRWHTVFSALSKLPHKDFVP